MPGDLSSVAREAAEAEVAQLHAAHPGSPCEDIETAAYVAGAAWCASRLPSREELAAVLRRHNFDELLLGNIEWDGYTAVCACGWSSEEYKMPGEAHEAHSEHAAANLLALIGEKIRENGNHG